MAAATAADMVADALFPSTVSVCSADSDSDDLLLLPNLLPSTAAAGPSSPLRAELHHFRIPSLPSPITVRALPSRGLSFQLWPSASTLLRVLPVTRSLLPPRRPAAAAEGTPLSVLELGSGTGAAGLALAAALPARAVLSDLPDALPNIRHNAELNAPLLAAAGGAASVVPLRWGDAAAMVAAQAAAPFELVVASDVVYYEALVDPLIETLRFFVKGEVVFLMAHMRRWKRTDKKFFGKARKVFDVEVVHEDPPLEGWRHGPVVYRFTAKKQRGKNQEVKKLP